MTEGKAGSAKKQVAEAATSRIPKVQAAAQQARQAAKSATSKAVAAANSATSAAGGAEGAPVKRQRKARLRLIQLDAWSVMKMAALLSVALGIVTIVAVTIIWVVLGAAGVFDSLNSATQTIMGNDFRLQDYIGTGRVLGFTMLISVVNVVLLTAVATLSAFLYNLAATLLGGIEVTLAEDN